PPNWWTGMKHHQIQLLVYGDKIGDLQPVIEYPNVVLKEVIKVQNPNYLFLNIAIEAGVEAGEVSIDFYKNKEKTASHVFPILKRNNVKIEGFNTSDAIYLITPDRFVNGNEANDSVEGMREKVNRDFKGGRHGGDIEGMRQSLDYIKDLGFTAIWLNPLLENDMEKYSYHGYSTTDFYKVDARFGTNEEYQKLANEGREKGLSLIMDMIVNHCGSEHWWMKDLPSEDWINQWESYTETNHQKTVLQDPYVSDADKKTFTDGWFVPTMPDLNQRNEMMAKYLIQNSIWWVEYLGLSGIRMDTYPYPDMEFMADWTEAMMAEYPNLNIVGEEWSENPAIVSYWQKGKKNANGYTSELKSLMDFPVQMAMAKALVEEENWGTGWIELYKAVAQDFLYADPMNLVIFPDNHDMPRFYAQVGEDLDLFKQGLAFVATMRGIPQMYYGTEILMNSPANRDDGLIRSDFPGGWKGDKVNAFTDKGLTKEQKETKAYLKKLLQWRKTATTVHTGKLKHFVPKDGIYVYFRYQDEQKVMVVLNKNETATKLDLQRFAEMLEGETQGKEVMTSKVYSLKDSLEVGARAALILELE
ncbi:MAG: glycoside hydrolase family 13 protein, partial [Chitinophagales bacterium]